MGTISGLVKIDDTPVEDALVILLEIGFVFYEEVFSDGTFDDTVKVYESLRLAIETS